MIDAQTFAPEATTAAPPRNVKDPLSSELVVPELDPETASERLLAPDLTTLPAGSTSDASAESVTPNVVAPANRAKGRRHNVSLRPTPQEEVGNADGPDVIASEPTSSDLAEQPENPLCSDPYPSLTAGEEENLVRSIGDLWATERKTNGKLRRTREELIKLRMDLSRDLHQYKKVLVRTGRSGRWHEFLRGMNIPRTTADRYVKNWELGEQPQPDTCPTGAIAIPTQEKIRALVEKLKPKLVRALPDAVSVQSFLEALAVALERSSGMCDGDPLSTRSSAAQRIQV